MHHRDCTRNTGSLQDAVYISRLNPVFIQWCRVEAKPGHCLPTVHARCTGRSGSETLQKLQREADWSASGTCLTLFSEWTVCIKHGPHNASDIQGTPNHSAYVMKTTPCFHFGVFVNVTSYLISGVLNSLMAVSEMWLKMSIINHTTMNNWNNMNASNKKTGTLILLVKKKVKRVVHICKPKIMSDITAEDNAVLVAAGISNLTYLLAYDLQILSLLMLD